MSKFCNERRPHGNDIANCVQCDSYPTGDKYIATVRIPHSNFVAQRRDPILRWFEGHLTERSQ